MARLATGVRKRPDGTFEKRFTLEGKRYSVYGKTTKELNAKEIELRKQIEAGTYKNNRNITLDQYFNEWIKAKRTSIKGNTLKTYKSHYKKHISPILGKRRVQVIERREVQNLQFDTMKKLSLTTCNGVLKTLTIILNDAVNDEIIIKNPAKSIKMLKNEGKKAVETYHRALTEQEQADFMQEAQGSYYYEFIAFLLCTGMRFGEVAALEWNDINYKENVIHVEKTATFDEYGHFIIGETPKTSASKRDIPMNDTIRGVLKNQKAKMQAFQNSKIIKFTNRVFLTINGDIVNNHAINREIKKVLETLEIKGKPMEHFTAHALRDTFATRYVEQNGDMQTLKTILGHSSLSMTMDLYAHVLPNTKQKEMDNLLIVI